jgi:hypothetical protein
LWVITGTTVQHLGGLQGAVAEIVVVGVIATSAMDLWQRLFLTVTGRPLGNWALVGRWVAGFPLGVFVHQSIAAAPSVRGELAIGWAFHYVVGFAYAAAYVALVQLGLGSAPTLLWALIFALARKALAFLRLASIRLMLRKLCNPHDVSGQTPRLCPSSCAAASPAAMSTPAPCFPARLAEARRPPCYETRLPQP